MKGLIGKVFCKENFGGEFGFCRFWVWRWVLGFYSRLIDDGFFY